MCIRDRAYRFAYRFAYISQASPEVIFETRVTDNNHKMCIRDRYVAEAKCLIASSYFNLFRMYGGLPLVTHSYDVNGDKLDAPCLLYTSHRRTDNGCKHDSSEYIVKFHCIYLIYI